MSLHSQGFDKLARFGYINPAPQGITLGTLEEAIISDQRMEMNKKYLALRQLRAETAMYPKDTPVSSLMHRLGGGILGYLIAKYFGLSPVGRIVASVAGYGLGDVIGKYYT